MPVPVYPKNAPKRIKKSARSRIRRYWWLVPVLASVILLAWLATGPRMFGPRVLSKTREPVKGYVSDVPVLLQEYKRFHGKEMKNPQLEHRFQMAAERVAHEDYEAAALILEGVSQDAAVPVVFNNLGVLYSQLNDRSRAINAFREALARDIDYKPVRANLDRLRVIAGGAADPVTKEIEPNNSPRFANVIVSGKPVEGEIAPGVNDIDYYRVATPPAPRDLITITVEPHSPELSTVLRLFDSDQRLTNMTAGVRQTGATLNFFFGPPPNTAYYLEISGAGRSHGPYTLKVTAQHAFDAWEPNDDIFTARRVEVGHVIDANIMDADDTDYYSFVAPRTGSVNVTLRNKSATLIPALTTFSPEMRNTGFGPDVRSPGSHLRHSFEVTENQTYYLQVWSVSNTAGEYQLLIE
jgi:hypothetical protein